MKQLTAEEAIQIFDERIFLKLTDEEIVKVQFNQDMLFIPFPLFLHKAKVVLELPDLTDEEIVDRREELTEIVNKKVEGDVDTFVSFLVSNIQAPFIRDV